MQENSDFSAKYVLCMRHTVVLILTGTCVLRHVSTATVPTQINMLHVALIPQLLQAHHTVLHNVSTSACQTHLEGLVQDYSTMQGYSTMQDYSTTQLVQDYSTT